MSSFILKIIAVTFMVIDHIGYFYPTAVSVWFRIIGRLSAPVFFYLLVEGYIHTHNRKKYFLNIFLIGTITAAINFIFMLLHLKVRILCPNIMFSLCCSLLLMFIIDKFKDSSICKKILYLLLGIIVSVLCSFTDASYLAVFMTLDFYVLRNNKKLEYLVYILGSFIIGFTVNIIQPFMALSVLFFTLYNGKRGFKSKYIKYFFYIFYPLHLFILMFIYKLFFI